jgi:hypothetical protein
MRLQVPDVDQKEFGTPEVLEFDLWSISVDDLDELSERFGFDPMDWPDPFVGEVTLDMAGDPDARPKPPKWRSRALVWMALRQNGFDVSWESAGKARAFRWSPLPEPEVDRGKDSMEDPASDPSDASTPQPSDTSTD